MTIETKFSEDGKLLVIHIKGKFDFTMLNEFRQAYCDVANGVNNYVVDMRDTSTIDSSALGMLLNMKRHLNLKDGEIKIINCNDIVNKVLHITNFNKKFIIE